MAAFHSEFFDLKQTISAGKWIDDEAVFNQIFYEFLQIGKSSPVDLFPAMLRDMFHEKIDGLMKGDRISLSAGSIDCDYCSSSHNFLTLIKNNDILNLPRAVAVAIAFADKIPDVQCRKEWRKMM